MSKFSYGALAKSRMVNLDTNDMRIASELTTIIDDLNTCIACGQCSSTCTAGAFTDFNFRRLHTFVRRGEYHNMKSEAEKCMLCGKCIIVCPRGINTRKVILTIRKLS